MGEWTEGEKEEGKMQIWGLPEGEKEETGEGAGGKAVLLPSPSGPPPCSMSQSWLALGGKGEKQKREGGELCVGRRG